MPTTKGQKLNYNHPRLTAKMVANAKPGYYSDGSRGSFGLQLIVAKTGRKHYRQRLRIHGKPTNLGLGPADVVSLAEAREAALENYRLLRKGGNPAQAKRTAKGGTFGRCWTGPKARA